MKYFLKLCFGIAAVLTTGIAFADDSRDATYKAFESLLSTSVKIDSLTETGMPNVYEVVIGGQIYHAFTSGDYILIGEIFETQSGKSLKDVKVEKSISDVVSNASVDEMITFPAVDSKRYVTVFTDIDCAYCRRFHREVPDLNAAGVEVRYLAFPRAGVPSASYDKYVNVWCSQDQLKAMTDAKNGVDVQEYVCDNPVASQFEAASNAGIAGTPMIVVDDGTLIGGYVPYQELLVEMGIY